MIQKLKRLLKIKQKTFRTYQEAAIACPSTYEDADLIDIVYQKSLTFRTTLTNPPVISNDGALRLLLVLQSLPCDRLRVLDFGGGCGYSYFVAKAVLKDRIQQWIVVETPAMANAGKRLEDGCIEFRDHLPSDRFDLVLSSGALQFVPDSYQFLNELINLKAQYLFLTRLALTDSKEFAAIQRTMLSENGPGSLPDGVSDRPIKYPVFFMNRDRLESMLSQKHRIQWKFDEGKPLYPFHSLPVFGYGYFATSCEAP